MSNNKLIPGAIVVAGLLMAVGVIFGNGNAGQIASTGGHSGGVLGTNVAQAAERSENPHITGNPDAPLTIVEFSDFECPFCARLHPTIERLVAESDGRLKWEYRHLPLPSHRNAEDAALAGECVAQLGGNDAFWDFADTAFKSQRSFGTAYFEGEATRLGIDVNEFRSCVNSSETESIVQADQSTALSFGGRGTPFSVIVFEDGSTRPVSGALPYEQWVSLLGF